MKYRKSNDLAFVYGYEESEDLKGLRYWMYPIIQIMDKDGKMRHVFIKFPIYEAVITKVSDGTLMECLVRSIKSTKVSKAATCADNNIVYDYKVFKNDVMRASVCNNEQITIMLTEGYTRVVFGHITDNNKFKMTFDSFQGVHSKVFDIKYLD